MFLRGIEEVGEAIVGRRNGKATVGAGGLYFLTDLLVLKDLMVVACL